MKRWIYVDCRDMNDTNGAAMVSFHHVEVVAETEEEAYVRGHDLMRSIVARWTTPLAGAETAADTQQTYEHCQGDFLNDYVICVEELPEDVTVMFSGYSGEGFEGCKVERVYLNADRARLDMELTATSSRSFELRDVRLICGDDK